MKAQTYLDIARGLDLLNTHIFRALNREDEKRLLATDAGALALLSDIEEISETCRQVLIHDSGVPSAAKALTP